MKKTLLLLISLLTIARLFAEDGYDLWLRYKTIDDKNLLAVYRQQLSEVWVDGNSATVDAIKSELSNGLGGLLNTKVSFVTSLRKPGTLIVCTPANTSIIKDTYFTNVSSEVKMPINLHGATSTANINGVHFTNLTVQGKAVTSRTDADATWSINSFVSNITFDAP